MCCSSGGTRTIIFAYAHKLGRTAAVRQGNCKELAPLCKGLLLGTPWLPEALSAAAPGSWSPSSCTQATFSMRISRLKNMRTYGACSRTLNRAMRL